MFISLRNRVIAGVAILAVIIVGAVVLMSGGSTSAPGTVVAAGSTCQTAHVTIQRAGPPALVAGVTYEAISITNNSTNPCTLPTLIGARGYNSTSAHAVGATAILRGTAGPIPVTLKSKGEAIFQFGVGVAHTGGRCNAKKVDDVQFSVDNSAWITVANPATVCTGTTNLNVTPASAVNAAG